MNADRIAHGLSAEHIEALAKGDLLAIQVREFYPERLCRRSVRRLTGHPLRESYKVAPHIGKIGKAIVDGADNPAALREYYRQAPGALRELRELFEPYHPPMDRLRVELQECWPAGSNLENLHGPLMFCGLVRLFEKGSFALPHHRT